MNIDAEVFLRGYVKDYVELQWSMRQHPQAKDFVIATGVRYSVRQFVEFADGEPGINVAFEGTCGNEVGPRYYRPTEGETLPGKKLGWAPKTTLNELVAEMAEADYQSVRRDNHLIKAASFQVYDYNE